MKHKQISKKIVALSSIFALSSVGDVKAQTTTWDYQDFGAVQGQRIDSGNSIFSDGTNMTLNWSGSSNLTYSVVSYYTGAWGGVSGDKLRFIMDSPTINPNNTLETELVFSNPVKQLAFSLLDVDSAIIDFTDVNYEHNDIVEVYVTGSDFPETNVKDLSSQVYTTGAYVLLDDETYANGFEGGLSAYDSSTFGNVDFNFGDLNVTKVRIVFIPGDDVYGFALQDSPGVPTTNPTVQGIGISEVSGIPQGSGPPPVATITANNDNFSGTPVEGGDTLPSVYSNDNSNGSVSNNANTRTPTVVNSGGLSGISFNANGQAFVPTNAADGTYTVTYRICLESDASVCDTATMTLVVAGPSSIDANTDNFSSNPVVPGGTTPSVFSNDLANGVTATNSNTTTPTVVSNGGLNGLTFNANGTANVPSNASDGTYFVSYRICLEGNSSVCDTATLIIGVEESFSINAVNDNFAGSPVQPGTALPSVYSNDTANGSPASNSNTRTPVVMNNGGLSGLSFNSSGIATIPANASGGTYTVTYQICLESNAAVCDNATMTVAVTTPNVLTINAANDNFSGTPVSAGSTLPSVFSNDTANGSQATNANTRTPVILSNGGLSGITMNASGVATVPSSASDGTYFVSYRVCLEQDSSICDTAVMTVKVENQAALTINAANDNFSASPVEAGSTLPSVLNNDNADGAQATNANTTTPVVLNNGGLTGISFNGSGVATVPANATDGTYFITYRVCLSADSSVCDTAVATIVVDNPVNLTINANNDDFTSSSVNPGDLLASVFANDSSNSGALTNANTATPVIINNGGLSGLSINGAGQILIPSTATDGSYTVTYRVCLQEDTSVCDTATALITVDRLTMVANNDNFSGTPVEAGDTLPSVYSNDEANGAQANNSNSTTPVVVNTGGLNGISFNANGIGTIPANAAAGTYTVTYRTCLEADTSVCNTATVSIEVEDPDTGVGGPATWEYVDLGLPQGLQISQGATITSAGADMTINWEGDPTLTSSVVGYETSNWAGINGGKLQMILDSPAVDPSRTLELELDFSYPVADLSFSLLDIDSAIVDFTDQSYESVDVVEVYVSGPDLPETNVKDLSPQVFTLGAYVLLDDEPYANGFEGGLSVFDSSTNGNVDFNFGMLLVDNVRVVYMPGDDVYGFPLQDSPGVPTTDPTPQVIGITNISGIVIGDYVGSPDPEIMANDDDFRSNPVEAGDTLPSVLSNDAADGLVATNANTTTPTVVNNGGLSGISFDGSGIATIPANAQDGTYNVTYQVCLNADNTICDTAVMRVTVENPVPVPTIVANNDNFSGNSVQAGQTLPSVFSNDDADGAQATNTNTTTPTITNNGGLAGLSINASGVITVPANAVNGIYTATYRICLTADTSVCDTATVSFEVNNPVVLTMTANDDDFSANTVAAGGTTPSVLSNDDANGAQAANANTTTPTFVNNDGLAGLSINGAGVITIPANAANGVYNVRYEVCLNDDSSVCDTASVLIAVSNPVPLTIVARNDDFSGSSVEAGATLPTVFSNDIANGDAATNANTTTPTITNNGGLAGISINGAGVITVPSNAQDGIYTVTYQVCLQEDSSVCDTATASLTVENPVILTMEASNDDFSGTPVEAGALLPSVFSNDDANGSTATNANTATPTITNANGLTGVTINAGGRITVPANAQDGTYTVTYQVCLEEDSSVCDTATATITVENPVILTMEASNDDFSGTPVEAGDILPSVLGNDDANGATATNSNTARPTILDNGGLSGLVINGAGIITVPSNAADGSYTATYQVCLEDDSTICASASVSFTVETEEPPIVDTCPEVIPAGNPTEQLTEDEIIFEINNGAISSFSVAGRDNPFSKICVPAAVNFSFATPVANSQYVVENGYTISNIMNSSADFSDAVLNAFADRNLDHYLSLDRTITSADYTDLMYAENIISAADRYVLMTERLGNNTYTLQALDADGNPIGQIIEASPATYISTGFSESVYNQEVFMAVYPLTALVNSGEILNGVRITQTGADDKNNDGADSKVYIMLDEFSQNISTIVSVDVNQLDCPNQGTVGGITINTVESDATNLEYSVNGAQGPFQPSNIFLNLPSGDYSPYVRAAGVEGCFNEFNTVTIHECTIITDCDEVIPPGNPQNQLTEDEVTFNFDGSSLESIEIEGQVAVFSELITPDDVEYFFQDPSDRSMRVFDGNTQTATVEHPEVLFKQALLDAYSDRDLKHYLSLDYGVTPDDYVDFLYDQPITSAGNRYVLITERLGNNAYSIQAIDANGNLSGNIVEAIPSTYIPTDVVVGNAIVGGDQKAEIVVYPLTALVESGAEIHGIRITQTGSDGSASDGSYSNPNDGGDGKVFIYVDPSSLNATSIVNVEVEQPNCGSNEVGAITINIGSNVAVSVEYSVNGMEGPFQSSNTFENLEAGVYTPYVRATGIAGCDDFAEDVTISCPSIESVCPEIIPSGNPLAALTANDYNVILNGSEIQDLNISSDDTEYNHLITPAAVEYQFANLRSHSQFITKDGEFFIGSSSGEDFRAAVLDAASNTDLDHYLSLDNTITNTDYVQYFYDQDVVAAGNRYVVITERYGNNNMTIQALDQDGNTIGRVVEANTSTYVPTGYVESRYNQEIYTTVYPLTALLDAGQNLSGIRITQSAAPSGSGGDGADSKVFIYIDPFSRNATEIVSVDVESPDCVSSFTEGSITINVNENVTTALEYSVYGANGPFQSSNTFTNLPIGTYMPYARAVGYEDCSDSFGEVVVEPCALPGDGTSESPDLSPEDLGYDPVAYDNWTASFFAEVGFENSGCRQDPDGDGLTNFYEYALGGNPLVPDSDIFAPTIVLDEVVDENGELILMFGLQFSKVDPYMDYKVEYCPNMLGTSWMKNDQTGLQEIVEEFTAPNGTTSSIQCLVMPKSDSFGFLRLNLAHPCD